MEVDEEDCCIYLITSYISWEEHSKIGYSYPEDIHPLILQKYRKKHISENSDSILLENKVLSNFQPSKS